ncbi:unnamed protein product [Nippostrongylus brasiliensis]|uniref:ADF-H domain-containing protein n=1 Tax=Nippostrongylus brasiliensis TaxID=27835 RepID=A0A0N4YN34_NIPBR|nr:unnamed protein product [Nippostrongylus brasiliensis]
MEGLGSVGGNPSLEYYGLEEFATSFNSGRLQYGVIGVRLAKNALTKIVLVHWQGEGVPSARVASTTSHIDAVKRFLKMVHVTIYARSEMDVEPDVIRREVAKLPATTSSTGGTLTDLSSKGSERWLLQQKGDVKCVVTSASLCVPTRGQSSRNGVVPTRKLPFPNSTAAKGRSYCGFTVAQYQGADLVPRPASPQRRVVASPSRLNSERIEVFQKKEERLPSPPSTLSKQFPGNKSGSPLPSISPAFSSTGTVSSLHNSTSSSISATHSPNDSGYEAGASESPKETERPNRYSTNMRENGEVFSGDHAPFTSVHREPSVVEEQHLDAAPVASSTKLSHYDEPPCDEIIEGLRAVALWDYQAAAGIPGNRIFQRAGAVDD